MKKTLIAVAAAAALFMASAAAEITFGAWINTLWAPVASDGDDIYSDAANSWGGYRAARFNIDAVSEDEKAGVHVDMYVDNTSLGLGDWAYIWAQPVKQIKLLTGKIDDGYLGTRGDLAYGSWNWYRPANYIQGDEGLTFSAPTGWGILLDIAPVDFVHIYGWAPVSGDGSFADTAEYVYGGADVIATVGIGDVAKVKVGWFGNYGKGKTKTTDPDGLVWKWDDEDEEYYPEPKDPASSSTTKDTYGNIEAAVDLTIIDPLYITVGFQYKVAEEDAYANDYDMKIALGASYTVVDALKISLSGAFFMYTNSSYDDMPMYFQIGLGLDYDMSQFVPGLALLGDVRYGSDLGCDVYKDVDDQWSFMIGATYGVSSNALIGIGFQGSTNGCGFDYHGILVKDDNFAWAVPIRLNVWM